MQRNFAKLLGYSINKHAEAEKTDRYHIDEEETPVEDELLEKLVMVAHANPYWLFDPHCESWMAMYDAQDSAVIMVD